MNLRYRLAAFIESMVPSDTMGFWARRHMEKVGMDTVFLADCDVQMMFRRPMAVEILASREGSHRTYIVEPKDVINLTVGKESTELLMRREPA